MPAAEPSDPPSTSSANELRGVGCDRATGVAGTERTHSKQFGVAESSAGSWAFAPDATLAIATRTERRQRNIAFPVSISWSLLVPARMASLAPSQCRRGQAVTRVETYGSCGAPVAMQRPSPLRAGARSPETLGSRSPGRLDLLDDVNPLRRPGRTGRSGAGRRAHPEVEARSATHAAAAHAPVSCDATLGRTNTGS